MPRFPVTTKKKQPRLALALEPRMMFDAAMVTTAAEVAAQVDVPASEQAPGVQVTPNNQTVQITDSTESFEPIDLFSDVDITLDSDAQTILEMVISINRSGSNEVLLIDGQEIALTQGNTDFTERSGYSYRVNVSGDTSTITLNFEADNGIDGTQAATLIDDLAYQALDRRVAGGDVRVTLQSLRDSGDDTVTLDATAVIHIDNQVNIAPELVDHSALDVREAMTEQELGFSSHAVEYSADERYAYVTGNEHIRVFAVDAAGLLTELQDFTDPTLGPISHMVVSADGHSLYTISGNGQVMSLALDAEGKISSIEAVETQNGNAKGGIAISEDGAYVYVGTEYNGIVLYSRNTTTGALSYQSVVGESDRSAMMAITADYVYVMTPSGFSSHTLALYQRNENGSLHHVQNLDTDIGRGFGTLTYAMQVSADGRHLYVANPTSGDIALFSLQDGQLSEVDRITQDSVASLALSPDGNTLYAAGNGSVQIYAVGEDGTLTQQDSVTTKPGMGSDLAVSQAGSLLVVGSGLVRYTRVQTLNLGEPRTFADGVTLSDRNLDAVGDGGNYKGASISITADVPGQFGFLAEEGLAINGNDITQDGQLVARLEVAAQGATLSFVGDVSHELANQIVNQLTYAGGEDLAAGTVVALTLQASDGLLDSAQLRLALYANSIPQAGQTSFSPESASSETEYEVQLPESLFSDADGNALKWSVQGLPEGLVFDPLTRTISGSTVQTGEFVLTVKVTDPQGASATRDLSLTVEQIDNRAPEVSSDAADALPPVVGNVEFSQVLDESLFTDPDSVYEGSTLAWQVSDLPPGVSFDADTRTLSGTPSQQGDYTLTITVTDEHGESAQHEMVFRVISQAESDNAAPVIIVDDSERVHSSDGRITDSDDFVYSVQISEDGRTVVVLGSSSGGWQVAPSGDSTLRVYQRDPATGALTLQQQFVQGESDDGDDSNGKELNGLTGAAAAVYSADGQYFYLVGQAADGQGYILTVFEVNADDGSLSANGQALSLGDRQITQMVAAQGGNLYAVAGDTLYALSMDEDGQLSHQQTLTEQAFGGTAGAVTTDAQGRVYVVGMSKLAVYERDSSGQLMLAADIASGSIAGFGRSVAVSGDYIYVSAGTNGIVTFQYDADAAQLSEIAKEGFQMWGLALSNDGKTLYAGNNVGDLNIYRIGDDGIPELSQQVGQVADAGTYRALRFAISADGSSLYTGGFFPIGGLGHINIESAIRLAYREGETIWPAAQLQVSDSEYDALDQGRGNYKGASFTVEREGDAHDDDQFGFQDGNGLSVRDASIQQAGKSIAELLVQEGVLSIRFTADVSTETANAVLKQISYHNNSASPEASIRLVLTVKDQFDSGITRLSMVLEVTQVNDAPELSTQPNDMLIGTGGASQPLFSDTELSTVEPDQLIKQIVLTVKGLKDGASEVLNVNGTQVVLVEGEANVDGYHYRVSVQEDGQTRLTIDHEGLSAQGAAALIDGITYRHLAVDGATLGERQISLVSVQDTGGTDHDGVDTFLAQDLTAQVTVAHESPEIGATPGSLELVEHITSDDYPNPYNGINDVIQIGSTVYAVRTTTDWVSGEDENGEWFSNEVTISHLYIFVESENGTLSLSETIANSDANALLGAHTLAASADGSVLSVTTDSGVALFSRNADGQLQALGSLSTDLAFVDDVQIKGDLAYVTSVDGLLVFKRGDEGWSQVGEPVLADDQSAWFTSVQFSSDGQWLFASLSGSDALVAVFSVDTDGALTEVDRVGSGAHNATSLALAPDGRTVYVFDDGALRVVSVAEGGKLTLQQDATPLEDAKQLMLTPDGSALVAVGAKTVSIYGRQPDGSLSLQTALSSVGSMNMNEVRGAALSADGKQLLLAGDLNWDSGLARLSLVPVSVRYVEGADPVVLLPGGTVSDPQLDIGNEGAGNYDGASLVVERVEGANADDVFGLLEANGLRLDEQSGLIYLNDREIASVQQAQGTLTVTFKGAATQAEAQQVLRQITYSNSSKDPAASAALRLTILDGDGNSDAMDITLTLEGRNDPAVVSTEVLPDLSYKAEGERIPLFENTRIDTVETGQNIWKVVVTVEPADGKDVLGVGAGRILLDKSISGTAVTEAGMTYQLLVQDGKAMVTLYVNRSADGAAAFIDSLSYGNTGDDLSGTRTIGLQVVEEVDWQHPDPRNDTTVFEQQAHVSLAPAQSTNTPPQWSGTVSDVSYLERSDAQAVVSGQISVADAQMDAFNGGKGNYDGAVLTVALGEGKSQADILAFQDGNGLSLEGDRLIKNGQVIAYVAVSGDQVTIRFSDAAGEVPTTTDVNQALHQITYANSSHAPVSDVQLSVTLADQRGLTSLALEYAIVITPINDAPLIDLEPDLSLGDLDPLQVLDPASVGLIDFTANVASTDGTRVYVGDSQGHIALFSRDPETGALSHVQTWGDQSSVAGLELSADGKHLYALQQDGSSSTLVWFAIDADGHLERQDAVTGLYDISKISVSEDGKNLYLIDRYTVQVYSRDSTTGRLTHLAELENGMFSEPYLWAPTEIVAVADKVFVVTHPSNGSSLIVYQRDAEGNLTVLTYLHSGDQDAKGNTVDIDQIQHVTVSADGQIIFIANGVYEDVFQEGPVKPAQKIEAFRLNAAAGTLEHLGSITDEPAVKDMSLSADGKVLLVTRDDGSLAYYSAITFNEMASSKQVLVQAGGVSILADGGVLVLGKDLHVLRIQDVPAPLFTPGGEAIEPFAALLLSDPELDVYGYQGARLIVTSDLAGSRLGFAGQSGYTLSADGSQILLDGKAVASYVLSVDQTSITIEFLEGATRQHATDVLRQISYAWHGEGSPGKASLSVSLTDQAENGETAQRVVEVGINSPPQLSETIRQDLDADGVLQRNAGDSLDWSGLFTDADGGVLTVSVEGDLPEGLRFDSANGGRLSGVLAVAGITELVLTATDEQGASVSVTIVLRVANVPASVQAEPVLDGVYVEKSDPLPLFDKVSLDLHGQNETVTGLVLRVQNVLDAGQEMLLVDGTTIVLRAGEKGVTRNGHTYVVAQDGAALSVQLTLDAQGLSASKAQALLEGVGYASTSTTPDVSQSRIVTLVSLSDSGSLAGGGSNTAQLDISASVTVQAVNDAPQPTGAVPDLSASYGESFRYHLPEGLFIDPDGDVMTLSLQGLPAGLSFDPVLGLISGTPLGSAVGEHPLVLQATDGDGASATITFTLQVAAADAVNPLADWQLNSPWREDSSGAALSQTLEISQGNALQQRLQLGGVVASQSSRPFGFAPVGAADRFAVAADHDFSGTRGLPFYINGARPWQDESEQAGARPHEPLLRHGHEFSTHPAAVQGTAQWDPLEQAYRYHLPDDLFAAGPALEHVVLAQTDGSPVGDGISLNVKTGTIHMERVTGQQQFLLIAIARDGRYATVQIQVDVPVPQEVSALDISKPGVSEQLATQTVLKQEAQALLARLSEVST